MNRARDASTPCLLLLLAALAAPSAGLLLPSLGPATPEAFLALAATVAIAWVAVVLPSLSRPSPVRVLEAALAATPFVAYGMRAATVPAVPPWAALSMAAAAGAIACALPAPWRSRIVVGCACLLGAALVAPGAGFALDASDLPRVAADRAADPEPLGDPIDARELLPAAFREADREVPRRPGSLARAPANPAGPAGRSPLSGARFVPVPAEAKASLPRVGPVVRAVGPSDTVRHGAATFVISPTRPKDVLDLDPYDALFVPADLAAEDENLVATLASYTRRGGLLVLSTHPPAIPAPLARSLSVPATGPAGPAGVAAVGLGRVARAAGEADVDALLAAGAWRPRWSTAFDRAISSPGAPSSFPRWRDDPSGRRATWSILVVFAVAGAFVAAFSGARRLLALLALSALSTASIAFLVPAPTRAAVEPFVIDLGGEGGRRVEGVFLSAGPRGYVVNETLSSRGGLRALGFDTVRVGGTPRLALPPGREGWIVEEGLATGRTEAAEMVGGLPPEWAGALLSEGPSRSTDPGWAFAAGSEPYRGPLSEGPAANRRARVCLGAPRGP